MLLWTSKVKGKQARKTQPYLCYRWIPQRKAGILALWELHVPLILACLGCEDWDWQVWARNASEDPECVASCHTMYARNLAQFRIYPPTQAQTDKEFYETMLHECIHVLLADKDLILVGIEHLKKPIQSITHTLNEAAEETTVDRMLTFLRYDPDSRALVIL